MSKLLLLDNYDSFTYNLYHYLEALSPIEVEVIRNDEISMETLDAYQGLIISPGPGLPNEANRLLEVIAHFVEEGKKILGICLGHQALAMHFGMELSNLKEVVHGQARSIQICDSSDRLFMGLPKEFQVGRYHSWVASNQIIPETISISAKDEAGNIMAMRHRESPIYAVQFHPESVLTEHGKAMLANWLAL